jgi:hypothetical protein
MHKDTNTNLTPAAVTLRDAMQRLGYQDRAVVIRLIAEGKLRAFRARGPKGWPGPWRISTASIDELLQGGAEQEASPNQVAP